MSPGASHASHRVSLFVLKHHLATATTTSKLRSSITTLKQYTATITNEYLRKFDDPYHFHNSVLHIHQKSFPIEVPSTIYQAIKGASYAPIPPCLSTMTKKRKALSDIIDGGNKARKMRTAEKDANREQG